MNATQVAALRTYRTVPAPLGLVVFLSQVGLGIVLFAVFQEYVPKRLGAGDGWGGYLLGAYGAARFMTETPSGVIADRLRRKSSLMLGFLFLVPAMAAMATVERPWVFLALAALLGFGTAFIWPAAYAICADLYPPERRGKVVGFLNLGQLLGFGAGALIGAFLVESHPRVMILIGIAMVALAGLSGLAGIPGYDRLERTRGGRRPSLREVWSRQIAMLSMLVFVSTAAVAMIVPAMRVYGDEQLSVSFSTLTVALIPGVFLGAALYIPAGHLGDRIGRTPPFLMGQILLVAGLLLVAATRSVPVAAAAGAVIFLGNVMTVPSINAAIMDLAPDTHRGTLIGLAVALSGLGLALGPAVGGVLAEREGAPVVFRLAAVISGIAALGMLGYGRRYGSTSTPRVAAAPLVERGP